MSARCIALADAVVTTLNATVGLLSSGVVASRKLFVEWDENRDAMQVIVIPGPRELSEGTRQQLTDEHTVQVGFRQRVADDAAAEAALLVIDRAIAALQKANHADAAFIGMENAAVYDYEALKGQRLLSSLLQLRFRSLA